MNYIYMTTLCCSKLQQQREDKITGKNTGSAIEVKTFVHAESEPVFRTIKRVYKFLDEWKMHHGDTPLLLSVDLKTAKIIHSYFYEMSEEEYAHFSMKEGEIRKYNISSNSVS